MEFFKSESILCNIEHKILKKIEGYIKISKTDENSDYILINSEKICINHISELLYHIVMMKTNYNDRINFLENIFINEKVIIFSCGPTFGELSDEQLKYYCENFITISVKYSLSKLKQLNLYPTIFIFNEWSEGINYNKLNTLSSNLVSIFGKAKKSKINHGSIQFNLKNKSHTLTFNQINNDIDAISWEKNILLYNLGHIMFELALPMAKWIGSKEIYTVGWDLDYKHHKYFSDDIVITNKKLRRTIESGKILQKTSTHSIRIERSEVIKNNSISLMMI